MKCLMRFAGGGGGGINVLFEPERRWLSRSSLAGGVLSPGGPGHVLPVAPGISARAGHPGRRWQAGPPTAQGLDWEVGVRLG